MIVEAKSLKTQFSTDLENGRIFKGLEAFPSVDKVKISFFEEENNGEKGAPVAEAELDLICVDQLSDADACGVGVFDDDTVDAFAELEESYIPLFTQDDGDGIFYVDAVLKSLYVDENIDDSLALTIINEMDWLLQFTLNIELRNLIVKIDQENPDHEKQLLELFLRSFMVLSKEPLYLARNYRLFR